MPSECEMITFVSPTKILILNSEFLESKSRPLMSELVNLNFFLLRNQTLESNFEFRRFQSSDISQIRPSLGLFSLFSLELWTFDVQKY